MPNYTRNRLFVKGNDSELSYFYEKNRVSEEDIKMCPERFSKVYDLCFEKMVPLFHLTSLEHIEYWGTYSNALDPRVDLNKMKDGVIEYVFETTWTYPRGWCENISKFFPSLTFILISQFEDDNYDTVLQMEYKKGVEVEKKSFQCFEYFFEKKGGLETFVSNFISFLDQNKISYNSLDDVFDLPEVQNFVEWDSIELAIYPSFSLIATFSDFLKVFDQIKLKKL